MHTPGVSPESPHSDNPALPEPASIESSVNGTWFTYWPDAAIAHIYDGPSGTLRAYNMRTTWDPEVIKNDSKAQEPIREALLDSGIEAPVGYPEVDAVVDAIQADEMTPTLPEELVEPHNVGGWFVVQSTHNPKRHSVRRNYHLMRLKSAAYEEQDSGRPALVVKRQELRPPLPYPRDKPGIGIYICTEKTDGNKDGEVKRSYRFDYGSLDSNERKEIFPRGPLVEPTTDGGRFGSDPIALDFYRVSDETADQLLRMRKPEARPWVSPLRRPKAVPLSTYVNADPRGPLQTWSDREAAQGPKRVFDELIDQLPDHLPFYPNEESVPRYAPPQIERYLASKMPHRILSRHVATKGTLAPEGSIACLRDEVRTKFFLLAIREAIKGMVSEGKEVIEVCDAGTGAFPVMALYAALCSDRVRCTALELNPHSAKAARQIIEAFGLENRIDLHETNAITFTPDPDRPIDVLVSETMNVALTDEPMVDIMKNLRPHVRDGGVILPSRVDVKAAIVSREEYLQPTQYARPGRLIQPIVRSTWHDVARYTPGQDLDEIAFSLSTEGMPKGTYQMALASDVAVGSRTLGYSQSLLSMPYYARKQDKNKSIETFEVDPNAGDVPTVNVRYTPGAHATEIDMRYA